jgi:hypothetical protein
LLGKLLPFVVVASVAWSMGHSDAVAEAVALISMGRS